MIIDKVKPYWTEEDLKRLADLSREMDTIRKTAKNIRISKNLDTVTEENEDTKEYFSLMDKVSNISESINSIRAEIEDRYIKSHSKKEILSDVQEIVNAVEKEDFIEVLAERKNILNSLVITNDEDGQATEILRGYTVENYQNCYEFISYSLRVQLNALANDKEATDKVKAIVEKRASLWYLNATPSHFSIPYSKPTDIFPYLSPKNIEVNKIGNAVINRFDVQFTIENFKDLKPTNYVGAHKLLTVILDIFAKSNDFHPETKKAKNLLITVPIKYYAQQLGKDITEHVTGTPEEAEAEKKRVKTVLDNVKKKAIKEADILYNLSFNWEEKVDEDLRKGSIRLLSAKEKGHGYITVTLTPQIADHMIRINKINQYNAKLLQIDERYNNAYCIMVKLEEHYNMLNNQSKGTHDRLSVPAILAVTDLPSYEYIQKTDRGHWEGRIKEPLMDNLDYLYQNGYLQDWKFTHARGVDLTDEEVNNMTAYEDFSKLYIRFVPAKKIDHSEKLEARREAKEKANKRKARKKKS